MNTHQKRRILGIAPIAVAIVLSVAACGVPCTVAGSTSAPASNGTSNGTGFSNTSGGSNGFASSNGAGTGTGTGAVGASGFGASGGSASGGSAVGGQGGASSGGSANAGSATPGQVGVSGGGSGTATVATGLTPDQVAAYCKKMPGYGPDQGWDGFMVLQLQDLRKAAPVQLQQNINVLITDTQATVSGTRVYAQVRDEIQDNLKPVQDFADQICKVH